MALTTVDYKETVIARIQSDPEFSRTLLDEAFTAIANGEHAEARATLRLLILANGGFERMAEATHGNAKSLHRMLGPKGNPSLATISGVLHVLSRTVVSARVDVHVMGEQSAIC